MDLTIRVLKSAMFFFFFGPPIGALVTLLLDFPSHPSISHFAALIPIMLLSYFAAAVPALVTGAISGALEPWLLSWRHYLGIGLLASAVTAAYALLLVGHPSGKAVELALLWLAPAFVAGVACSRICYGPPNNSSKPTPLRGAA